MRRAAGHRDARARRASPAGGIGDAPPPHAGRSGGAGARSVRRAVGPRTPVIDAILEGLSAKECARELGLSPTSIATYRQRAFEKLGIHRQVQLFQLRKPH
ncbi:hypothetical protein HK414_24525 [Ramlibacter terrae]|uniref:HTH luxR-type domain-containing protein n=1 Tax=Ramlibacter terrae TaxID=2732511 RepID=A0ABX6P5P1_9BURK|nr:hypothetical protein HK414_24525 [Ramlibacter terrae]